MAIIEKIKKFVKDITPPSDEQKVKIEELLQNLQLLTSSFKTFQRTSQSSQ